MKISYFPDLVVPVCLKCRQDAGGKKVEGGRNEEGGRKKGKGGKAARRQGGRSWR